MLHVAILLASLTQNGCVWPMTVAEALDVRVMDSKTMSPIPFAEVVYLACDWHDFDCNQARLIRTRADKHGALMIDRQRRWGLWLPAPGGIPVPIHLIAIWSSGYSPFIFGPEDVIQRRIPWTPRRDIRDALEEIPLERGSNYPTWNPQTRFIEGAVMLQKSGD